VVAVFLSDPGSPYDILTVSSDGTIYLKGLNRATDQCDGTVLRLTASGAEPVFDMPDNACVYRAEANSSYIVWESDHDESLERPDWTIWSYSLATGKTVQLDTWSNHSKAVPSNSAVITLTSIMASWHGRRSSATRHTESRSWLPSMAVAPPRR
jgi:hypothetical protein